MVVPLKKNSSQIRTSNSKITRGGEKWFTHLIPSVHVLPNFSTYKQSQQVQWIVYLGALGVVGRRWAILENAGSNKPKDELENF